VDGLIASLTALIAKKRAVKHATMQQLLTGKTRLAGFTGEWEVKRLGDVCNQFKTGKLDANAMKIDGEYRFYTCARDYYFIDYYAFDAEALLVSGNGANVGYIHYYKTNDLAQAWKYFTDTERYCEMAESNQTQYYYYAKLFKARIAVKQDKKDDAIALYEFLKEECDSKSEPYKEAKAYLKKNKPREKWFGIF
jgi:restriction endonuclease S subunit